MALLIRFCFHKLDSAPENLSKISLHRANWTYERHETISSQNSLKITTPLPYNVFLLFPDDRSTRSLDFQPRNNGVLLQKKLCDWVFLKHLRFKFPLATFAREESRFREKSLIFRRLIAFQSSGTQKDNSKIQNVSVSNPLSTQYFHSEIHDIGNLFKLV